MTRVFFLILIAVLTVSCSKDDDTTTPAVTQNFIEVSVSGPYGGKYTATGDDVAVGTLGLMDNKLAMFSVGLTSHKPNGKIISISSGLFPGDLTKGVEQKGINGDVGAKDDNDDNPNTENYSSMYYGMFYPVEGGKFEDEARLTFSMIEFLPGNYIHLVGTFHFRACDMPSPLPLACIEEAWKSERKQPAYLADLAGTKEVSATGKFDVTFPYITYK